MGRGGGHFTNPKPKFAKKKRNDKPAFLLHHKPQDKAPRYHHTVYDTSDYIDSRNTALLVISIGVLFLFILMFIA